MDRVGHVVIGAVAICDAGHKQCRGALVTGGSVYLLLMSCGLTWLSHRAHNLIDGQCMLDTAVADVHRQANMYYLIDGQCMLDTATWGYVREQEYICMCGARTGHQCA